MYAPRFVCVSTCLFLCVRLRTCVCPCLFLGGVFICLLVCLCVCLRGMCESLSASVRRFFCACKFCLFVCLFACAGDCMLICLFVCLLVCFVCPLRCE